MENKNEKLDFLLETINIGIEAGEELLKSAKNKDFIQFQDIIQDLIIMVGRMDLEIMKFSEDAELKKSEAVTKNILYSLKNIEIYERSRSDKLLNKIEFELIPLFQELKVELYYWGFVYEDETEKQLYFEKNMKEMCSNKYIDKSEKGGKYKYDLSILIVGYNKLEYTKMCVESLLKNVPSYLNYELILVNHGSNDGTKEYFEKIAPTKQLDLSVNGGGFLSVTRIIEGKIFLSISNDVIITENAIDNMIRCINSNEKIGCIVPTTSNICNLQTIDEAKYKNFEEMNEFVKNNNKLDVYRWEERFRLCNPLVMGRSRIFYGMDGIHSDRYYFKGGIQSFPDDKLSLLLRRKGYKLILQKDAYCHHFGNVTLGEEITKYNSSNQVSFYDSGRTEFRKMFEIDPWGKGMCFEKELINSLNFNKNEHVEILGINCGLGSNPLKIKEEIKEKAHNEDVIITNVNLEKTYSEDLKLFSDEFIEKENLNEIEWNSINKKYDYIIIDDNTIKDKESIKKIKDIYKLKKSDGYYCVRINNDEERKTMEDCFGKCKLVENWVIIK